MTTTHDDPTVLKYCELLDEFIRVRTTNEEDSGKLLAGREVPNRAAYHELVVDLCVMEYRERVLPLFEQHNKVYQPEALVELLYQICIEVNPHLEIHSVTLPTSDEGFVESRPLVEPAEEEPALMEEQRERMLRRIRNIEEELCKHIIGQPNAVRVLSRAVKKAAVGLKDPRRPVGVFLLVGPTGTGKTEMAKALTQHLFGDLSALIRVDCSEFALPHEYAKLIGAPPGYIGHNEGGQLTEAVKQRKTCVVLFDEIEKAHEKVHNLLLQLMDEGTLTDSKGEQVPFHRCIVLLTSNLGIDDVRRYADRVGFGGRAGASADTVCYTIDEAVKKAFRPEFVNRLDEIVHFRPLTVEDCTDIARIKLREMAGYLERTGVKLKFSPALEKHLARLGWSAEYGARELRRFIRAEVEDPLGEALIHGRFRRRDTVAISVRAGKVALKRVSTRPRRRRAKLAADHSRDA